MSSRYKHCKHGVCRTNQEHEVRRFRCNRSFLLLSNDTHRKCNIIISSLPSRILNMQLYNVVLRVKMSGTVLPPGNRKLTYIEEMQRVVTSDVDREK